MADSDTDDTPVTPRRRPSRKKSKRGQVSALANSGGGGLRQSLSDHNIPGLFQSFRANKWLSNDTDVPTSDDEGFARTPLSHQVSRTSITGWPSAERDLSEAELGRRKSHAASVLMGAEMRSQRLIGSTNPRYRWEQYWKPEAELKKMRKPVRKYYERNNDLIQQYRYIDELLDSSLPHDLIEEYSAQVAQSKGYGTATGMAQADVPETIDEEEDEEIRPRVYPERHGSFDSIDADGNFWANGAPPPPMNKVKRTPKDIYRLKKDEHNANGNANGNENGNLNASVNNNANKQANGTTEPNERQPLLGPAFNGNGSDSDLESGEMPPDLEYEEEADTSSPVVRRAIWVNTGANFILLILKLIVVVMSSSVSVLASLVDAALDFLSTAIVSVTTWMISRTDQYAYPIGRRRLEPVGVLVFSVIMITAFLQVFYEAFMKLTGGDREVVELSTPAIVIMASTVVVKGLCWVYCRLIKNSSVQALAQDAVTDVVFNTFSIIFPLGKFSRSPVPGTSIADHSSPSQSATPPTSGGSTLSVVSSCPSTSSSAGATRPTSTSAIWQASRRRPTSVARCSI